MATQTGSLASAEHDWYATRSGLSSSVPLNDHKRAYYISTGITGGNKPIWQIEREWLQKFARSTSNGEGDLWRELVSAVGETPTVNTSENKYKFFTSSIAQLGLEIMSTSGLVAYYPFNETSGNAVNRATSTFGTLVGTVSGATQNSAGKVGTSYSLDGVNDNISIADNASLDFGTGDFTLSLLLKTASFGENRTILYSYNADTGDGWQIANTAAVDGTVQFNLFLDGNDQAATSSVYDLETDAWIYLVATRSGSVTTLYINGSANGIPGADGTANVNNGGSIFIGSNLTPAKYFVGNLQHVSFFNVALSSAKILTLARTSGVI